MLLSEKSAIANHISRNLNKKLCVYIRYFIERIAYYGTSEDKIKYLISLIFYKDAKDLLNNPQIEWLLDNHYYFI